MKNAKDCPETCQTKQVELKDHLPLQDINKEGKSNFIQFTNQVIKSFPKWCDIGNSILNGVIGDYLEKQGNELAIEMNFYHDNAPIVLESDVLKERFPDLTSKICILVHGLCINEQEWHYSTSDSIDYGACLQKDLGYTPFYLRYNSGLHISENGKRLSDLMKKFVEVYPVKISEIIFICHSMGGLVARSACNTGTKSKKKWIKKVKQLFFLATPHMGTPFERFGNVLTYILKQIDTPYTKLTGDIINLRSSAIKDLRYGYITDEDWQGFDPDALLEDNRKEVPLLQNASHYNIAASLTKDSEHPFNKYIGDPLVTLSSAFGQSKEKFIPFLKDKNIVFTETGHIKIAKHVDVYKQIYDWCKNKK